jgi:hypothetical protein
MADVFISYKTDRRNAAQHLARILELNGYSVWFDYGLLSGRDFGPQIEREIRAAKAVIVLWCSLSRASRWVLEEAELAERLGTFTPVWLQRVDLPLGFARADTIDLTIWDGAPRSYTLDRLLIEVARRVGRDPIPSFRGLQEYEATWRAFGAPHLSQFALIAPVEEREDLHLTDRERAHEPQEERARAEQQRQRVERERHERERRAQEAYGPPQIASPAEQLGEEIRAFGPVRAALARDATTKAPTNGALLASQVHHHDLVRAPLWQTLVFPWKKIETPIEAKALTMVGAATFAILAVLIVAFAASAVGGGPDAWLRYAAFITAAVFGASAAGTYKSFRVLPLIAGGALASFFVYAVIFMLQKPTPVDFAEYVITFIAGVGIVGAIAGARGAFATVRLTNELR